MIRPLAATCLVLAATLLSLPAEAQWKWRDKSGHTQYSDLPPPQGTPDADILARPSARGGARPQPAGSAPLSVFSTASGASSPLAARTTDSDLEAKRKKAEADAAAKTKADEQRVAAARADNCQRARGSLRSLESGVRVSRTNDKGEREILDDAGRAAEIKRTQDVIGTDCK